ncbi:phage head closure protein [Clostridium gasigenes]|uniref:phage head closure protein n=1 Tax=Clostridium gasigenes TaxID=94869 RepID=UPI00143842D6|nr:phage head closure protein [Clostridium gasigenes]NKF05300.1 phage head closure protein [Clostridium gasigenes]QSW18754.1 phage head closure protein [Clostridium gasigenes]
MDYKINIGDLNKRITIQELKTITTDNGFEEEKWVDSKTVWAKVNNLFGKEFWSAKAINQENSLDFIIRYSKDLSILDSKTNRIYWNERAFNITFIDNIQYKNTWIKIKGIEVV